MQCPSRRRREGALTPPLRTEREIVSHAHIPTALMDTRAHAASAAYGTVAKMFDMELPLRRGCPTSYLYSSQCHTPPSGTGYEQVKRLSQFMQRPFERSGGVRGRG